MSLFSNSEQHSFKTHVLPDYAGKGAEIVHQEFDPGCQSLLLESHELWLSYLTQNRSLLFSLLYKAVVTEEIIVHLKESKYQHVSGLKIANSKTNHLAETFHNLKTEGKKGIFVLNIKKTSNESFQF